jgi:hypothetical protein
MEKAQNLGQFFFENKNKNPCPKFQFHFRQQPEDSVMMFAST